MAPYTLRILAFVWIIVLAQGAFTTRKVEEQHRQENTIDCSSPTNNNTNACSATISSAALTPRAEEVKPILCAPDTCGADGCPKPKRRSLDKSAIGILSKRGSPAQGEWVDPSDYDDKNDFLPVEIGEMRAGFDGSKVVKLSAGVERTTSDYVAFEKKVLSIAVTGLYGCTSVIVISRRGAWASHIWEGIFAHADDDNFQQEVIDKIHRGDNTDEHKFGVDQLRNQEGVGSRGVIFGDQTDPEYDPKVHVFVVTPRTRVDIVVSTDPERNNRFSNLRAPAIYSSREKQIRNNLRETFGPISFERLITYAPLVPSKAEVDDLQKAEGAEKARAERDAIRQRLADADFDTPRGKVMIQYRPGKGCREAGWRMFVEGDEERSDNWAASDAQLFDPKSSQLDSPLV
ncbi:hypothetical protein FQN54_008791 [Arachnomyces sp. PD_36]|nr:hypothetical protein FQN54_008791 [Arachnomyces sp. PD_36]